MSNNNNTPPKYFDLLTSKEQATVVADATLALSRSGTSARYYAAEHDKKKEELAKKHLDYKDHIMKYSTFNVFGDNKAVMVYGDSNMLGDVTGSNNVIAAHNATENHPTVAHDLSKDAATIVSGTKNKPKTSNNRGKDTATNTGVSTLDNDNDDNKNTSTVVSPSKKVGANVISAHDSSKDSATNTSVNDHTSVRRRIFDVDDSSKGSGSPPAKRTKLVGISTPNKLDKLLFETDNLDHAKSIGLDALDNANWYKNELHRTKAKNRSLLAKLQVAGDGARYKEERDTWVAYGQRTAAERNQARSELDEMRQTAVRLAKERDQARADRDAERSRADFYEEEFDRMSHHISRL